MARLCSALPTKLNLLSVLNYPRLIRILAHFCPSVFDTVRFEGQYIPPRPLHWLLRFRPTAPRGDIVIQWPNNIYRPTVFGTTVVGFPDMFVLHAHRKLIRAVAAAGVAMVLQRAMTALGRLCSAMDAASRPYRAARRALFVSHRL